MQGGARRAHSKTTVRSKRGCPLKSRGGPFTVSHSANLVLTCSWWPYVSSFCVLTFNSLPCRDSNPQPSWCEASTLPIELPCLGDHLFLPFANYHPPLFKSTNKLTNQKKRLLIYFICKESHLESQEEISQSRRGLGDWLNGCLKHCSL